MTIGIAFGDVGYMQFQRGTYTAILNAVLERVDVPAASSFVEQSLLHNGGDLADLDLSDARSITQALLDVVDRWVAHPETAPSDHRAASDYSESVFELRQLAREYLVSLNL